MDLVYWAEIGVYSLRLDWNSVFSVTDDRLSLLLDKYSEVFKEELGSLKGFKAKLWVNDDNPIYCKARPVPYSVRSLVEDQIDKLVDHRTNCLFRLGGTYCASHESRWNH